MYICTTNSAQITSYPGIACLAFGESADKIKVTHLCMHSHPEGLHKQWWVVHGIETLCSISKTINAIKCIVNQN